MKPFILAPIALLAIAASTAPAAAQPPADSRFVDYVVRRGDNLYALADRYLDGKDDFTVVRRLNRVADPHRLRPGSTLRIPRGLLRQELASARVEAFSGPVRVTLAGRQGPAAIGMPVGETGTIETGANAFLTLRLADGSTVSIPSQSRVTVSRMRRTVLTGAVERLFDIETGRARAVVTPMKERDSSFRLMTPIAIAAVRGTEFQVRYDPDRSVNATEVLEGTVGVGGAKAPSPLMVGAGYGTLTTKDGAGSVVKLLPAPALADPGRVQSGPELAFAVRPLEGASGYHLEVARDADFLDRVEEVQTQAPTATLPSLPTGTYFVRVAGIDVNGLEGLPATYGFERRLNTVEGGMDSGQAGRVRRYQFRWFSQGEGAKQFRFQLSTHEDGSQPFVDEIGLMANNVTVTNLPSGDYYWRVMSIQFVGGKANGSWGSIRHFHIEVPK